MWYVTAVLWVSVLYTVESYHLLFHKEDSFQFQWFFFIMSTNSKHFCTAGFYQTKHQYFSLIFVYRTGNSLTVSTQINRLKATQTEQWEWHLAKTVNEYNAEVDTGPWQMFNKCVLKIKRSFSDHRTLWNCYKFPKALGHWWTPYVTDKGNEQWVNCFSSCLWGMFNTVGVTAWEYFLQESKVNIFVLKKRYLNLVLFI